MTTVNPEILVWARETAGLSLADAARKLAISSARGKAPEDRLSAYESGEVEPPRTLLLKMAKQYHRPLLTFYMEAPPRKGDRGQDFRTLPDAVSPLTNATVDAMVRDIRVRQSLVRSVLEDDEDLTPLNFIGAVTMQDGRDTVAAMLIKMIGFSLAGFRAQPTVSEAFKWLRDRVEATGVYVLLLGNLGSHHTSVNTDVFRGFALSDPIAPFIVINDQDAQSAWSFTLLHECVHLMLGVTGISGQDGQTGIERFCNDVAGEVLLPSEDVGAFEMPTPLSRDMLALAVSTFASERRVSSSMAAYQLYRRGRIPRATWMDLAGHFRERWRAERSRRREDRRSSEGGPSYYVVKRHRVGNALLSFVRRSMADGDLTPTKAARVLGVNPRGVHPMLRGEIGIGTSA